MALTLIEAAKRHSGNVLRSSIIEIYARSSDILAALPFDDIAGNAYSYNQEGTLPGIGFRGVNEGYSESTGILNPKTEQLAIAGGDLDVDKFILKTMGMDQRSAQEAMKVKVLAHKWAYTFIKGDSVTNPKEFDGLQTRITGNQLIDSGTNATDPLSLAKLDELIDAVDEPTHLLMCKAMRRRLTTAARTYSIHNVQWSKDGFGDVITSYNGLPIMIADPNGAYFTNLGFNETSSTTSIYCLSLKPGMVQGLQNGVIDVTDLGELDTKPCFRTRVEWYATMAILHPRAAARLYLVTDAAVTQ